MMITCRTTTHDSVAQMHCITLVSVALYAIMIDCDHAIIVAMDGSIDTYRSLINELANYGGYTYAYPNKQRGDPCQQS